MTASYLRKNMFIGSSGYRGWMLIASCSVFCFFMCQNLQPPAFMFSTSLSLSPSLLRLPWLHVYSKHQGDADRRLINILPMSYPRPRSFCFKKSRRGNAPGMAPQNSRSYFSNNAKVQGTPSHTNLYTRSLGLRVQTVLLMFTIILMAFLGSNNANLLWWW